MTENEGDWEGHRFGGKPFVFYGDGLPAPTKIDADVAKQSLSTLEMQTARSAMKLMLSVMAWSRTYNAAALRMICVKYVIFRDQTVDDIARHMKVTPRRVRQVIREVRKHCAPFLKLRKGDIEISLKRTLANS